MKFSMVELRNFAPVHTDTRRSILECNFPASSVQYFTVTSISPLGNHFHKEREETFVILKGSGKCIWLALDKNGQPSSGKQIIINIQEGSVIQILPFTAHAFCLEPESAMICFSSIRFDVEYQDMFPYPLDI